MRVCRERSCVLVKKDDVREEKGTSIVFTLSYYFSVEEVISKSLILMKNYVSSEITL